jgi:hypothetical protein
LFPVLEGAAWGQAVKEGSTFFPCGVMALDLTLTTV